MDKSSDVKKRILEGESLLCRVKNLEQNGKQLSGFQKLTNRIKSEIRFLSKIYSGDIPLQSCHTSSSNLSSLRCILEVVEKIGSDHITEVLHIFKDDFDRSICVDVAAQEGHLWIKVIARNASALHTVWKGKGQYGEKSLLQIAKDYMRIAKCNPIDYQVPEVLFCFMKTVPVGLARNLIRLGVQVHGDLYECVDSDTSTDEEDDHCETVQLTKLLREEAAFPASRLLKREISKANLDVSSMLTLVSNLSNGYDQFHYDMPVLDDQAKRERQVKVLPRLKEFLETKKLIACESAVTSFREIVNTIAGAMELQRANDLLERVAVVPDNPSKRTLSLISSSKLNRRSKIIFGTGDFEQAVTVTANTGFVRAALQNGVRYSVFEHEARALTERKEKDPIKLMDPSSCL